MTPLEYFAAHAPPPDEWFEPEFTLEKLPVPTLAEGLKLCDACKDDWASRLCTTPEVCTLVKKHRDKRIEIARQDELKYQRARLAQWPWVWAKMVLQAHPDTMRSAEIRA